MRHTPLLAKILLGGLLLTACVDKSYDLNDIDMTLSTNANLALPLINTSEIKLVDFVLPSDFLNTTTIPNQDGQVIYAHTKGNFSTSIPVLANGSVNYNATTPDITIPNLPDFLKGEGVRLDLKNPIIIANVDGSSLPTGWTVKASFNISKPGATLQVANLNVIGGQKCCQYIANSNCDHIPANLLAPEYGTPTKLQPVSGTVNSLFKDGIPEKLEVEVSQLTANGPTMGEVGPFDIKVDLTLYAPLCVGSSNFCLSYETTETGWKEEFTEDVRKMDIDALDITAKMINELPLSAELTVTPIDPAGNTIPGLNVLKTEAKSYNSSTIEYTFKANDTYTLRDYLNGSNGAQQLDGVKIVTMLKANAESEGKYITDKASIRFTNLTLRARGKVTYDAN